MTTQTETDVTGLDFPAACGMWRCRDNPNPATHTMTISPPHCPCVGGYLICGPCIAHFWQHKADRMTCEKHPGPVYTWASITWFDPL